MIEVLDKNLKNLNDFTDSKNFKFIKLNNKIFEIKNFFKRHYGAIYKGLHFKTVFFVFNTRENEIWYNKEYDFVCFSEKEAEDFFRRLIEVWKNFLKTQVKGDKECQQ